MLRRTYSLWTSKSLKSTGNIGTISFHQTQGTLISVFSLTMVIYSGLLKMIPVKYLYCSIPFCNIYIYTFVFCRKVLRMMVLNHVANLLCFQAWPH